jgi:structure-specific endonuclease subunit SLX1
MTGYSVYVLHHPATGHTYVGATSDVRRRLRQHNGGLVGGARYTTAHGGGWVLAGYMHGFPTLSEAYKAEWMWKHVTQRKVSRALPPLERRMQALVTMLEGVRSTSTSTPWDTLVAGGLHWVCFDPRWHDVPRLRTVLDLTD